MRRTLSETPGIVSPIIGILLAAALALAGVILVQSPAEAHDHRVPRTVLMEGKKELQVGRKVDEFSWTAASSGGECVHQDAVLDFRFPRGVPTVEPGSKLRVRIHKTQKPRFFELVETDGGGDPTGGVEVLRLKPVVRGDETVAWDAVFRADRPDAEYRLKATGRWRDREGCGPADQFAFWSFRFRTADPTSG